MNELKFIGFGERAAMQQWLSFTALVAVGIKVILGQDWHINYWDLCSSVFQLLFIQGETGHSGSTGPHRRKSRPHRWDAWGCTQWTLATYRLSREVFWEGCRQKRGCRGWKEERKEGRRKRREAQSLKSSVRSGWGHVTVRWQCTGIVRKGLSSPMNCILKSSSNLKRLHWYYLPSSFE